MDKLKQFWGELPHSFQAAIVAFGGGFIAALVHAYSDSGAVWTLAQLKHELPTFLASGFVSLRAYLMIPQSSTSVDNGTKLPSVTTGPTPKADKP